MIYRDEKKRKKRFLILSNTFTTCIKRIYIYTFLQLLVLTAGRGNIIFMCVRLKMRYN